VEGSRFTYSISLIFPRQRGKDVKKEEKDKEKTPSEVLPAKSITPALSTAHRRRMKQTTTDAIARKRSVIRPPSFIKAKL